MNRERVARRAHFGVALGASPRPPAQRQAGGRVVRPAQCALTSLPFAASSYGGSAASGGFRGSGWRTRDRRGDPAGQPFRARRGPFVLPHLHGPARPEPDNARSRPSQVAERVLRRLFEAAAAYPGLSFRSPARGIDNENWFYNLAPRPSVARDATRRTPVGDAATLNIWPTRGPGYLGFATLPVVVQARTEGPRPICARLPKLAQGGHLTVTLQPAQDGPA